jgi:hypothetical protein
MLGSASADTSLLCGVTLDGSRAYALRFHPSSGLGEASLYLSSRLPGAAAPGVTATFALPDVSAELVRQRGAELHGTR